MQIEAQEDDAPEDEVEVHDQLAAHPDPVELPSVVNRTNMWRCEEVCVEGVDEPEKAPMCLADVDSPSYTLT